nr:MAG TPA: hypothetical protein [Caudoviricetes sp.]
MRQRRLQPLSSISAHKLARARGRPLPAPTETAGAFVMPETGRNHHARHHPHPTCWSDH